MRTHTVFILSRLMYEQARICTTYSAKALVVFLLSITLFSKCLAIEPRENRMYDFSIPTQSVASALDQLAEQAGAMTLFPYELVAKRKANAVVGRFTLPQALAQLLENTGLSGVLSDKYIISISEDKYLPDTEENSMKISKKGLFAFLTAAAVSSVGAQNDNQNNINTSVQPIEEIVTIGSRRAVGRTLVDSPVPIDVVGPDELLNSGITETNDLLARALPSFNFPQPSVTDGTDSVRPAQLRGLAPDQTLVLVNGKRRHTSALLNLNGSIGRGSTAVDLNHIPANAIKRIEVLRDGAAAQYGSDAIAGVINIVLKDAPDGGSFSVTYGGNVTKFDGVPQLDSVGIDAAGDLTFSTGSERDVSDGETTTVRANIGFPLGNDGFVNVSAEFRDHNATNRSDFDSREAYDRINGALDPRELTYDRYNTRFGTAATEDFNIFINAGAPVSDSFEAYGVLSYGTRDGESAGFNRLPGNSRNIQAIYPDGFLPLIIADVTDISLSGGVRGEIGSWLADFSLTYGENEFAFGVDNSLNVSLGPSSQTSFDAGDLINDQITLNADFSKLIDWGGKEVNVAFGGEYRDESYQIRAGETNSFINGGQGGAAGSQVFPGFQPSSEVNRSRDSFSIYGELDTDLSDRWNLAIATRFEDFSDFGSTFNGKIATRVDVSEQFSLRGAVSTGFRAPSLAQQNFTSVATVFVDSIPTETGTFRPDSEVAQALGSIGLDSESSLNISAGFVWTPTDALSLTVDAYQIDIDDRIILTENLGSADVQAILTAANTQATRARFFFNGIDTRTKGLDIVASYNHQLETRGRLSFTAAMNLNDTEVTSVAAAPAVLANVDLGTRDNLLFARREQKRFEVGSPESKFTFSTRWDWERLTITGRATRYGETVDAGTTPAADEVLPSEWIVDLDVRYSLNEALTLSFGANNLFDTYPKPTREIDPAPSLFDRVFPYSGFSPFGFSGRYLYGRLSYDFQ